jgi:hypothetical protein
MHQQLALADQVPLHPHPKKISAELNDNSHLQWNLHLMFLSLWFSLI